MLQSLDGKLNQCAWIPQGARNLAMNRVGEDLARFLLAFQ